jgi:hypothetical protein
VVRFSSLPQRRRMYRQNVKRTKPYHTYLYHREEGCIDKMLKELNLTTHIYTTEEEGCIDKMLKENFV